jgi:EAL domain-containing protein (putative c-di-GMP-specific phosphodiesterase class I)
MDRAARVLVIGGGAQSDPAIAAVEAAPHVEIRWSHGFDDFVRHLSAWEPTHVVVDLHLSGVEPTDVVRHLAREGFGGALILTSEHATRVLETARRAAQEEGLSVTGLQRPLGLEGVPGLLSPVPAGSGGPSAPTPPLPAPAVDAAALERALSEGALTLAYQPKITCESGDIFGFEVLARWSDPVLGEISPTHFVPLAERSGLIDRLTEDVAPQALHWFGAHFADTPLHLCLNVSARSLTSGFAERILDWCTEAGVDPRRVMLELTETSLAPDPGEAHDVLTRLSLRGVALALDDFGSGYASLLQLARLPFSEVKIDRSFIGSVTESHESRTIVKAVLGLGRSLDLRVIAEGVEDEATFDAIVELGCDLLQGNYVAPAMTGDEAITWYMENIRRLRGRGREVWRRADSAHT